MKFIWDENKNLSNQKKHKISFETASLIFNDPMLISELDDRFAYSEERWQSIGLAEKILLSVAHVMEEWYEEEIIRIVSARKAGPYQARRYYYD